MRRPMSHNRENVSREAQLPGAHGWAQPQLRIAIAVALVAIGAAVFAVAFRAGLALLTRQVGGAHDVVSAIARLPLWARVLLPAAGALLAGVVSLLSARGTAGVGNVMEAVVLGGVHLSMRITLLKSLASFIAIVSGGSLGREGPLIQFGGAMGNLIGDRLRLDPTRTRLLIAAGTAAGFAAAYNTPFAAVLFVLEVVTGVVVLDAILSTLVATVIAVAITRAMIGDGPVYGARTFRMDSLWELVAFAGLGLVAAVGSQLFMRLLTAGEHWFNRRWLEFPWRPALGGLIAGVTIAVLPEVAGNGYEPLNQLLDGSLEPGLVLLVLLGKAFATTASVSSGSPGGVFTPTLLIGGALGWLYSHVLTCCGIPVGSAGGYALVGMAAATAATIHAPLMAAVMVFELSGDYAIVLPLILATALATLTSRRLRRDSIYTAELHRRGIEWEFTLEGRRIVRDARAGSTAHH